MAVSLPNRQHDPSLWSGQFEYAQRAAKQLQWVVPATIGIIFPLLIGRGTGSEVMRRLAAPMVGGMITAPLLSLFVLPAIYKLPGAGRLAMVAGSRNPSEISGALSEAKA